MSDPQEPSELDKLKDKVNELVDKYNKEVERGDSLQKELIQLRSDLPGMADQSAIKRLQSLGIPIDDNGNPIKEQPQQTQTSNTQTQQVQVQGPATGLPLDPNLSIITTALQHLNPQTVDSIKSILQAFGYLKPEDNALGFDFQDYKRFRDIRDTLFREKMKQVAFAVEKEFNVKLSESEHGALHEVV